MKQLILSLDERNRFIIMDLDETHLLISPDRIDWLRSELEVEVSLALNPSMREEDRRQVTNSTTFLPVKTTDLGAIAREEYLHTRRLSP